MEMYERINRIASYKGIKSKQKLMELIVAQGPILKRTGKVPSAKSLYAYFNGSRGLETSIITAAAKALGVPESVIMQGKLNGKKVFTYNDDKLRYDYSPVNEDTETIKEIVVNNDYYEGIKIRKYDGAVGAGSFGVMDETLITNTILPSGIFNGNTPSNTKHLMAFEVAGDSMSPVIDERNWVIIDMVDGREYYPTDGIYLCNINSSYQIKRLQFLGTQGVEIISENPKYNTRNSKDCDIFEIIGKLYTIIKIGSGLALKE